MSAAFELQDAAGEVGDHDRVVARVGGLDVGAGKDAGRGPGRSSPQNATGS